MSICGKCGGDIYLNGACKCPRVSKLKLEGGSATWFGDTPQEQAMRRREQAISWAWSQLVLSYPPGEAPLTRAQVAALYDAMGYDR